MSPASPRTSSRKGTAGSSTKTRCSIRTFRISSRVGNSVCTFRKSYSLRYKSSQFEPITLKHRVVMPPMSRLRAQWPSGIPSDLQLEYYRQRASEGGLIFTEATAISTSGRGYKGAPGLYSDEQVTGGKRITDAVHAKGGYIFTQLWHA